MNILGPAHVMELVIPKLEEILAITNNNYVLVREKQDKNEDFNFKDNENKLKINGIGNLFFLYLFLLLFLLIYRLF